MVKEAESLIGTMVQNLMRPAIKKKWLKKPCIPIRRYLGLYQMAFETGAVLGFTYQNQILLFAKLFSGVGREEDLLNSLREVLRQRVSHIPNAKSFLDLGVWAEDRRVKGLWCACQARLRKPKVTEQQLEEMLDKQEIAATAAFGNLQTIMSIGISFGSNYPETTRKFWGEAYEQPTVDSEVNLWRSHGLDVPTTIEPLLLSQQQAQLQAIVDAFVSIHYPELVNEFNKPYLTLYAESSCLVPTQLSGSITSHQAGFHQTRCG